jgi:hypothetical protein
MPVLTVLVLKFNALFRPNGVQVFFIFLTLLYWCTLKSSNNTGLPQQALKYKPTGRRDQGETENKMEGANSSSKAGTGLTI